MIHAPPSPLSPPFPKNLCLLTHTYYLTPSPPPKLIPLTPPHPTNHSYVCTPPQHKHKYSKKIIYTYDPPHISPYRNEYSTYVFYCAHFPSTTSKTTPKPPTTAPYSITIPVLSFFLQPEQLFISQIARS